MAYQQTASAGNAATDVALSDFYYVYGMSEKGEYGWYIYDASTGSIQRSIANMEYRDSAEQQADTPETTESGNETITLDSVVKMVIGVLGLICLLLLALVIIFAIRYKHLIKKVHATWDDEEDEEEVYRRPEKARKQKELPTEELPNKVEKPKKANQKMVEVEIPGTTVNMMDLDNEDLDGYDMQIPPDADYDLTMDNTPEDEDEYDHFGKILQMNLAEEMDVSEEEPEYEEMSISGEKPEYEEMDIPKEEPEYEEMNISEEEPEYYDDEDEEESLMWHDSSQPENPSQPKQESELEPDDDLEFL